jgi:hypothetical protein
MHEFLTLEAKVSIQEMIMPVFLLSQIMIELSNFKNGMRLMVIQGFNRYLEQQVMGTAGLTSIA